MIYIGVLNSYHSHFEFSHALEHRRQWLTRKNFFITLPKLTFYIFRQPNTPDHQKKTQHEMPVASPRPPSSTGSTLNVGPTLRSQQPTQKVDASKSKIKTVEDSASGRQWLSEAIMLDHQRKLTAQDLITLLHDIARMGGTISSYRNAMHAIGYLLTDVTDEMQKSSYDSKLNKHSSDIASLMNNSTDRILQSIEKLEKVSRSNIASVNKLTATATNMLTSSNNNNNSMTYAQAARSGSNTRTSKPRNHQKILEQTANLARNIVLVPSNEVEHDPTEGLSTDDLLTKGRLALTSLDFSDAPPSPELMKVQKTQRRAIVYTCNSLEVAEWIRQPSNSTSFLAGFSGSMKILGRQFPIIVEYVPVNFDPINMDSLRQLEKDNEFSTNSIKSACWIKPIER